MNPALPTPVRHAGLVGLAAAAFLTVAALLRSVAPFADEVAVKVDAMRCAADASDARGDVSAVFVGSSRVLRAFRPDRIDAATGLRTFNLGLGGMTLLETTYLVRRVLDAPPPSLRWIFLEPQDIGRSLQNQNAFSDRESAWHDLRHARAAVHAIFALRPPNAAALLHDHCVMFFHRLGNYARGPAIMRGLFGPPAATDTGGGYAAQPEQRHPDYTPTPEAWQKRLDGMRAAPGDLPIDAIATELLVELQDACAETGIHLVFVIPPSLTDSRVGASLAVVVPPDAILSFGGPALPRELYADDLWYDPEHLNPAGAAVFSETFARELARLAAADR